MLKNRRMLLPIGAGLAGGTFLFALYIGIVSIGESPQHAIEFFWEDRWLVIPIIIAFAVQVALFVVLKLNSHLAPEGIRPHGVLTGANGVTSTVGMVSCCAHHVVDVLPIIGFASVASFLAAYRTSLMLASLIISLIGVGLMLTKLLMNRHKVVSVSSSSRAVEAR